MTMNLAVYIFVVGFVIHFRSAATTLETGWLKDTTTKILTGKRTQSTIHFPNELSFQLIRRSETLNLNLRRNHDINPNPDFYFARKLQNGQLVLAKSRDTEKEDVAYYQDIKNGAYFSVRCVQKSNEHCDRIINGNVRIGHRDYVLQPVETDVASRNVLEDQDIRGRQYVLQDQTHINREYTVDKKDEAHKNMNNTTEKRMTRLRHFHEQYKQMLLSPSFATLSSRNVSTLHNRGRTDKSRELPQVYYVKVAVLLDKGSWNFYYSWVHGNILTRSHNAKRKIKQFYSHIFNGVNLLYKGIEDDSIRINVILSEFIIFKRTCEFQLEQSNLTMKDGKVYVDAESYLFDLKKWDETSDLRKKRPFSHGMLFTRYQLYEMYEDDIGMDCTRGLAFNGKVCTVGHRMSVVKIMSIGAMVHTAAHELGHSLGASHDGEYDAADCKAEDEFIMSAAVEDYCYEQNYTKNQWIFSNCSVRSFKEKLKDKTCVFDSAPYYNNAEYHQHVINEPGEVFTVQEQCELINGRGSILCELICVDIDAELLGNGTENEDGNNKLMQGYQIVQCSEHINNSRYVSWTVSYKDYLHTEPEDICLRMRCTDPKKGICVIKYHRAGRGTECDRNKWCIDGLCVPKRKP